MEIQCGDKIRANQDFICGDKNMYMISKNTVMEVTQLLGDAIVVDNKEWEMQHWIEKEDFDKIKKVKQIKFSNKIIFGNKSNNKSNFPDYFNISSTYSNKPHFNFSKSFTKNVNPGKDFEIAKKLNKNTLKALEYLEAKHFAPNIEIATVDTWFPKIEEDNLSVCVNLSPEGFKINILDSKYDQTWYSDVVALINGNKRNYGTPTYEIPKINIEKKIKKTYEERNGNLEIYEGKVFNQENCGEQHSYTYNTELIVGNFANVDWQFLQWSELKAVSAKNKRKKFIEECSKESTIGYCLCKILFGSLPPPFDDKY
jgi:hypothetical protein